MKKGFFLLPTHMSQEEKNNGNIKKKTFIDFLSRKIKNHTKMINIFGFFFFFQQAKPTCSFFNVTAR